MRLLRTSPLVTALSLVFVLPSAAIACSCASTGSPVADARAILERSDAAFIGVLESVRTEKRQRAALGVRKAVFRYRVRRAYGARLGRFVRVRGGAEEGSCGLVGELGRRYALGLAGSRGSWASNLCQYMNPRALRRAADSRLLRASATRGSRGSSGSAKSCAQRATAGGPPVGRAVSAIMRLPL